MYDVIKQVARPEFDFGEKFHLCTTLNEGSIVKFFLSTCIHLI